MGKCNNKNLGLCLPRRLCTGAMHEAPKAPRDPLLNHVCAIQADNPKQLHAMLSGPGSIKTAALLKGQGQPLRAIMTMNDMRRGRA